MSYRHIACCVDHSEAAQRGVEHGARLARQLGAERFSLVHFVAPPVYMGVYYPPPEPVASEVPDWLREMASGAEGAEAVVVDSIANYPPAEAVAWAAREGVDMLVAASHQGFFRRMVMGSFAAHLAYHAPCPVMLVPPPVTESEGSSA